MNDDDGEHDDLEHDDRLDVDPEDREAAVRARSAELLARQPTPEELAEHAERSRANRLAAALAPESERMVPRYSAMVTKRRDNAALHADRAGSLLGRQPAGEGAALHAHSAAPPPARSAKEQRVIEFWATRLADLWKRMQKMGAPDLARALLAEIAGLDVANARRQGASEAAAKKLHRRLKKRIRALEAQAAVAFGPDAPKPRYRVKAGRLPH